MKRRNLIERRKKLGLTQQQAAEKAVMDRAHYSMIELGTHDAITLKTAQAIGNALNYKVDPKGLFTRFEDDDEKEGDD